MTHQGFSTASLEDLAPRRFTTDAPELSSELAAIRRVKKDGKTAWIPPNDAAMPSTMLSASAVAWLESHTAFYPLRAWLRLSDHDCTGHDQLAKYRRLGQFPMIDSLPKIFPTLASMFGDHLIALLRRAFAFVVDNAYSYADNQWASSSWRTSKNPDTVLGEIPRPMGKLIAYNLYTQEDKLPGDVSDDPFWPKMDRNGYLPKGRAIDNQAQNFLPPVRLLPEERDGNEKQICERACAKLLLTIQEHGGRIIGGLHRHARQVLGECLTNLSTLPVSEQEETIKQLIPVLAGRVRGDMSHPEFFTDCYLVLKQLIALGGDTRRFRAEEPIELLRQEAAEILAQSR